MPTEEQTGIPDFTYVKLDDYSGVDIIASATYGDLLIALLLTVLIVIIVSKWLHHVILGGKK